MENLNKVCLVWRLSSSRSLSRFVSNLLSFFLDVLFCKCAGADWLHEEADTTSDFGCWGIGYREEGELVFGAQVFHWRETRITWVLGIKF